MQLGRSIACLFALTSLVIAEEPARDARYPAVWWQEVPRAELASWEIPPQDAGPGEVILSKRNELGLLSNLAATPFTFHGKRYASLEGLWQAMKYPESADDPRAQDARVTWPHTRAEVTQMSGFESKHAGDAANVNMKLLGIDWVSFEGEHFPYKPAAPGRHYELIVEATREKVRQNPEVRRVLLATGDLILKPDHNQGTNALPAWRYHEILMQIRTELQELSDHPK